MNKELQEKLQGLLEQEQKSIKNELESFATRDKNDKDNWNATYPNREDGTMEEEADETEEYDNLLSLEHSLESRLKDVELALGKMEKGGYGLCEVCNKEIEEERLLACPEARTCMAHAKDAKSPSAS